MKEIRVPKATLIRKMQENREKHSQIVEEAQVGYRKAVIERLDEMLADAKAGRHVDQYLSLPIPDDHTADYDTVIGMLEMDINDFVDLDQSQYRQWVEDNWGWRDQFLASNSVYSMTASASL